MTSVNTTATHKFAIVLNEKSPIGKLFSATGQIAMSLYHNASSEQRLQMTFHPFLGPLNNPLIALSLCSFVVLKANASQLLTLYAKARDQGLLSVIFSNTMSYHGIEEDLIEKTANTPLDQTEPYGVGVFTDIETLTPLTKKFSIFK